MINIALCVTDHNLPRAFFSGPGAFMEFSLARRRYEAAIEAFSMKASPAGISASIAAARRYGFQMTRVEAREAALDGLRESLSALGYDEAEIRWHAARRGRRDRALFVLDDRTAAARREQLRKQRTH